MNYNHCHRLKFEVIDSTIISLVHGQIKIKYRNARFVKQKTQRFQTQLSDFFVNERNAIFRFNKRIHTLKRGPLAVFHYFTAFIFKCIDSQNHILALT